MEVEFEIILFKRYPGWTYATVGTTDDKQDPFLELLLIGSLPFTILYPITLGMMKKQTILNKRIEHSLSTIGKYQ